MTSTVSKTPRGVLCILDNVPIAELVKGVQGMETLGYDSYWIPELLGREPMATAAYLLANTSKINIATGIANVYVRDPNATVQAGHTLTEMSGGRFILGLGVSNVGMNTRRGHVWEPPMRKMSTYLDDMAAIEPNGAASNYPAPVHLAAHGPKLQALASERTNGPLTYLMSPAHTRVSRQRIGSEANLDVVCMMLAEKDPTKARTIARQALAYYLTLDYYHREWRELGFSDADFADGGSDALIDTIVGWGDEEAMEAHIAKHVDAGASRILIMPLDFGVADLSSSPTLTALSPN